MGALLPLLIPLAGAILPLLLNKGADGSSPASSLWDKVKGMFGNIFGHPSTTVAGAGGTLSVLAVSHALGCTVDLSDYKAVLSALAPLLFGAFLGNISGPKAPASPAP